MRGILTRNDKTFKERNKRVLGGRLLKGEKKKEVVDDVLCNRTPPNFKSLVQSPHGPHAKTDHHQAVAILGHGRLYLAPGPQAFAVHLITMQGRPRCQAQTSAVCYCRRGSIHHGPDRERLRVAQFLPKTFHGTPSTFSKQAHFIERCESFPG